MCVGVVGDMETNLQCNRGCYAATAGLRKVCKRTTHVTLVLLRNPKGYDARVGIFDINYLILLDRRLRTTSESGLGLGLGVKRF